MTDATARSPLRSGDRSPWTVLLVASLAVFMVFLDTQVLFVAFNNLRDSFPDVSSASLSWVLSAYTIVLAALLVPAGRLADRIGRRKTFLVSLAAFTMASALCAVSPSAELLIAFRAIQAIGAAGLLPSSLAIVLSVFPREKVPVAVAVWGAVGALAAAVGPTIGAVLIDWWDWRAVFLINVPVGLFTLAVWRNVLPESKEAVRNRLPDWVGTVLVIVSIGALALAVVQSDEWGWGSAKTIGSLAAGAVLLAAFILRTRSVTNPAVDLKLFRARSFRWANVSTFAFTIGFTAMFFANIQFLTAVWGYSLLRAGMAMAPGPLVVMLLAPQMGKLAGRIGQRALLIPGGLIYAVSGLWLYAIMDTTPNYLVHYLPSSLFSGLAVAFVMPQLSSAAVQDLPPSEYGVGSAVNQSMRQLGSTFGVAVTVTLIGQPSPADAMDRFHRVWIMLIVCGVLTSAAASRLAKRRTVGPVGIDAPLVVAYD